MNQSGPNGHFMRVCERLPFVNKATLPPSPEISRGTAYYSAAAVNKGARLGWRVSREVAIYSHVVWRFRYKPLVRRRGSSTAKKRVPFRPGKIRCGLRWLYLYTCSFGMSGVDREDSSNYVSQFYGRNKLCTHINKPTGLNSATRTLG